ncbi:MBL fold metallo-hydrolase [Gordonia sp. NPDC003585]|uniref:MBL fold metallo-hydrolase n=1 Tax=unclassified Gordonia (in: high G+C Gram-positive bacteria) TaxID=2657482 RepID=UPI0033A39857
MTVRVHHLNCGSMRPLASPRMICHVLAVETDDGIVVVDTGFGLCDIEQPTRLGLMGKVLRPDLKYEETAIAQIEALDFDRRDVRHVVVTHLDLDHAGGIADFPEATLHVTDSEYQYAGTAPGLSAKIRYGSWRSTPEPTVERYAEFTTPWHGFDAAPVRGVGDSVLLVSLPGHTPGHAGVAVNTGDRWLLHCGDAFYHHATIRGGSVPFVVRTSEGISAISRRVAKDTRRRLSATFGTGELPVDVVCAHDPVLLGDHKKTSGSG